MSHWKNFNKDWDELNWYEKAGEILGPSRKLAEDKSRLERIRDSVVPIGLGAVSFPAGFFAGSKGLGNRLGFGLMGAFISLALNIYVGKEAKYFRETAYESENAQIEHVAGKKEIGFPELPKYMLTNSVAYSSLKTAGEYDDSTTILKINTKDGSNKISGEYKLDGFKDLKDIDTGMLNKPYSLEMGSQEIEGPVGKRAYNGLLKKVFSEEKDK